MTPPPAARTPSPGATREAELTRAETELSAQEARLAEELAHARAEAAGLATRLDTTRTALEEALNEPDADPAVGEHATRLQMAVAPTLDVEASRQKALKAREAALEARRKAAQEQASALRTVQTQVSKLSGALTEAQAVLDSQVEATAARTRARQEAAKARQAELARAAAQAQARGQGPAPQHPGAKPQVAPDKDARRNGRVRMHTSIDMRSDSNFFTGFSMDISEGGVFIATVDAVQPGTQVELDFTLPGGKPLKVTGVVRWVREANPRMPELMPGVGVQFTGLPPEVASAITGFVTTRDPLFFPD
ncbi:MAG TPA: TIGR02266 family protein [Myxococcus sp.]|jgi:uncharacterized protein (TIGR02266 family)|nr:TIGR02266 family protein [Myxococcus sp.]